MSKSNCIQGVPRLTWRDKDMPFAGALEAATAPTPNPLAFDEVLALTGFSMGFRWWEGLPGCKSRWCMSSMDIGYFPVVLEAITRYTGIGLTPVWYEGEMSESEHEKLYRRVMDSIDAGNAVLCSPFGNMGVIVGYEEQERTLLVQHYLAAEPAKMSLKAIHGPPYLIFLEQTTDSAYSDKMTLAAAMHECVSLCSRDPMPYEEGEYHFGAAAWRRVCRSLSELDSYTEDDQKRFIGALDFALHRVYDCRKAALCFLARYGQSVVHGGQGQRWDLGTTTAIAGCLLAELDHFSKYTFYAQDTASRRDAARDLVKAVSESDAELRRICAPDEAGQVAEGV